MEATPPGSNEQATGLEAILAPVQARRSELLAEREVIASQMAVVDDELKRLNAVLRAAFPQRHQAAQQAQQENHKPSGPSKRPGATGRGISQDKTDELETWVRDWLANSDHVTQTDARLSLGWDQSRVSAGFQALRDRNVLRLAGTRGSRKIYRPTTKVMGELNAAS